MCGCKKRQQAIVNGTRAILKGDTQALRQQGQEIRASFADDRAALRNALNAARARLAR